MSYHIRIDHRDPGHVHFTVFIGKAPEFTHANAGSLILTPAEFDDFIARIQPTQVVRLHAKVKP